MHAVESVRRESSRRTLAAFQTSRSNLTACDPFSSPPAPFLRYFCLATRSVRATARCVGSLRAYVLCERLSAALQNASIPRNTTHQADMRVSLCMGRYNNMGYDASQGAGGSAMLVTPLVFYA